MRESEDREKRRIKEGEFLQKQVAKIDDKKEISSQKE